MSTNVVSFLEKKANKERGNKVQLTKPIFDFYIPLEEQNFWMEVANKVANLKINHMPEMYQQNSDYVKEFIIAFPLDIEMYNEFATLDKFRFIFNYIELQILSDVLKDMKKSNSFYKKEIKFYVNLIRQELNRVTILSEKTSL